MTVDMKKSMAGDRVDGLRLEALDGISAHHYDVVFNGDDAASFGQGSIFLGHDVRSLWLSPASYEVRQSARFGK